MIKLSILPPLPTDGMKRCTSHTPSMQTFLSLLEQDVPSLTLLDMAKKKSKSSAMQYSLQMSSSAEDIKRHKHVLRQETCCLKWKGVDICKSCLRHDGWRGCQVEKCSVCSDAGKPREFRTQASEMQWEQSCCSSMAGKARCDPGKWTKASRISRIQCKRLEMRILPSECLHLLQLLGAAAGLHQFQSECRGTVCTVPVGPKWKRQELTKKAPTGVLWVCRFILSFRSAITDKLQQPSLIKINYGGGDSA